jgi:hypothetical protein
MSSSNQCHGCQQQQQQEHPPMKKCSGCLNVYYCSLTCQYRHWPEHEKECSKENNECPICYDEIADSLNKTITECGHCFHSNCLIKHALLTNVGCPLCRQQLADVVEQEEDSEEELDYSSYDDDYSEEDSDEDEDEESSRPITATVSRKRTMDTVLKELKRRNITEKQMTAALLMSVFHQRWMNQYFVMTEEEENKYSEIIDILGTIHEMPVDFRDERSYADVLQGEHSSA